VALASHTGRRDISVRTIAGGPRRAVRLARRRLLIDAAVDAATRTTYVLSGDARGNVRLTEIARDGAHRSHALRFCRRRQAGQVEASGGLVAVACAGRVTSGESVLTGGDSAFGRNEVYLLLRGGKLLRRQSFFEGDYSY
jgi:hypothetical protein